MGSETVRALAERGVAVDLRPEEFSSAALFESLRPHVPSKKVLLPQSDRANPTLVEQLRQIGAQVDAVVAYRVVLPQAPDADLLRCIRSGQVDALAFASPSAVYNFAEIVGRTWLRKIRSQVCWASIGPTTTKALREHGVSAVEAEEATSTGLARALTEYFSCRP